MAYKLDWDKYNREMDDERKRQRMLRLAELEKEEERVERKGKNSQQVAATLEAAKPQPVKPEISEEKDTIMGSLSIPTSVEPKSVSDRTMLTPAVAARAVKASNSAVSTVTPLSICATPAPDITIKSSSSTTSSAGASPVHTAHTQATAISSSSSTPSVSMAPPVHSTPAPVMAINSSSSMLSTFITSPTHTASTHAPASAPFRASAPVTVTASPIHTAPARASVHAQAPARAPTSPIHTVSAPACASPPVPATVPTSQTPATPVQVPAHAPAHALVDAQTPARAMTSPVHMTHVPARASAPVPAITSGTSIASDQTLTRVPAPATPTHVQNSQQLDFLSVPARTGTAAQSKTVQIGTVTSPGPMQTDTALVPTPPLWYREIKPDGPAIRALRKNRDPLVREALLCISFIKATIHNCIQAQDPALRERLFDELRDHLHKVEFLPVNKYILKLSKFLENQYGLPRLWLAGPVAFPWDISTDAKQLYIRWCMGIFNIDLLRGLIISSGGKRNRDKLDPKWPGKKDSKYHGGGHLVLGQWWPSMLTMIRDGAHGHTQAGISGSPGLGAFSIVLSGGSGYNDRDEDYGDIVYYWGTDAKRNDGQPTQSTLRLIESCDIVKQPVRVFRSMNLKADNPYRPECGYRYDGLYDVVSYEISQSEVEKAAHRFKLVRQPGQHPIRCALNGEKSKRPTKYEVEAYHRMKDIVSVQHT